MSRLCRFYPALRVVSACTEPALVARLRARGSAAAGTRLSRHGAPGRRLYPWLGRTGRLLLRLLGGRLIG